MKKKHDRKIGAKIATAISSSNDLAEVNRALKDVFGKSLKGQIRNVEIEFNPEELGLEGEGGWDGNVYRYTF